MLRDGRLGERDEAEAPDELMALRVNDQPDAGVDIISDGEFRRQRLVFELHDALEGLERLAP
jgi:methionine synthase II (cobalamin-independent)